MIVQAPPAGTTVGRGSTITIVVGLGPDDDGGNG